MQVEEGYIKELFRVRLKLQCVVSVLKSWGQKGNMYCEIMDATIVLMRWRKMWRVSVVPMLMRIIECCTIQ